MKYQMLFGAGQMELVGTEVSQPRERDGAVNATSGRGVVPVKEQHGFCEEGDYSEA